MKEGVNPRIHSYRCTLDSTLDMPMSDEMYNTETGDFGLSFLVSFLKLKNYEELTYAHGLCLLSLPFISLSRRIG